MCQKFVANRKELVKNLEIAKLALQSGRINLPVLANVRLESYNGNLNLFQTNLELGIIVDMLVESEGELKVTLPIKVLLDNLKALKSDKVTLELGANETAILSAGGSRSLIKGLSVDEYPGNRLGESRSYYCYLDSKVFTDMTSVVSFCSSNDGARPVLTGVLIGTKSGTMKVVSTDGFRIARISTESPMEDFQVNVPAITTQKISKILQKINYTGLIDFSYSPFGDYGGSAFFMFDNVKVITLLIDGVFPDTQAIFPPKWKYESVLDVNDVLVACNSLKKVADAGSGVLRFSFSHDKTTLSSRSEELGESESVLENFGDPFGDEFSIDFNIKFITDIVASLAQFKHSHSLVMRFNHPNRPALFTNPENENLEYLVMPMHLG